MEDRTTSRPLTIGQLSELTGVPVRTIRFYSDTEFDGAALVRPIGRSQSGYRLYDVEAVARLELIRTLRDLDVDLPTIARVLARKVTVAEVARTHAAALEATVKVIRLRQAVLRAVAVRDCDWKELELMHRLAKLDATERKRILDDYLDKVFGGLEGDEGTDGQFAQTMRQVFPGLPEDPTAEQVEAWVELVVLIQDDDFVARSRQMAEHGARKRAKFADEEWQRDQEAFAAVLAPQAEAAYRSGLDPVSEEGRERVLAITRQWAARAHRPDSVEEREELRRNLELMSDQRVNRFWVLVGQVGERPEMAAQGAPLFESMEWLIKALSAAD